MPEKFQFDPDYTLSEDTHEEEKPKEEESSDNFIVRFFKWIISLFSGGDSE